jgi:pimeloyl-ACP methyl ester carboxylesterase
MLGALVCQACRASVSRARHLAPDNQRTRKTVPVQAPDIRYARSGDVAIAYSILGDGPIDLVAVHGFAGNLDFELESPYWRPFHDRLASFSRHVMFDRRGTGLSDRMREAPTLETRMDDLRAVLDAIGSESAVLFGTFEAASMCLLFAATYPERTRRLVLYNPVAKGTAAPDYPGRNRSTRGSAPAWTSSSPVGARPKRSPSGLESWPLRWPAMRSSSGRSRAIGGSVRVPGPP